MKNDARRQKIAEEIRKLSEAIGSLVSKVRWAARDLDDPRIDASLGGIGGAEEMLFLLAQDTASGRLPIAGPDSPRPLFDRPQAPTTQPVPRSQYPPGTRLMACNKCNRERPWNERGAVCPDCGSPEYRLTIVMPDGGVGPDAEARRALEKGGKFVIPPETASPLIDEDGRVHPSSSQVGDGEESTPVESSHARPKRARQAQDTEWTIIDKARPGRVEIGTVTGKTEKAALTKAQERHPGLMRLRVERKEAAVATG